MHTELLWWIFCVNDQGDKFLTSLTLLQRLLISGKYIFKTKKSGKCYFDLKFHARTHKKLVIDLQK